MFSKSTQNIISYETSVKKYKINFLLILKIQKNTSIDFLRNRELKQSPPLNTKVLRIFRRHLPSLWKSICNYVFIFKFMSSNEGKVVSSVHFIFSVIILSQLIFFYGIYFKWMIWNVEWSDCCYARGEKRHWHTRWRIIYEGISLGNKECLKKSKTKNIYFISFFTSLLTWADVWYNRGRRRWEEAGQFLLFFSPSNLFLSENIYGLSFFFFLLLSQDDGLDSSYKLPLINQKGF